MQSIEATNKKWVCCMAIIENCMLIYILIMLPSYDMICNCLKDISVIPETLIPSILNDFQQPKKEVKQRFASFIVLLTYFYQYLRNMFESLVCFIGLHMV